MRSGKSVWKIMLVISSSFFLFGMCNKGDDNPQVPDADEYYTWRIPGYNGNMSSPGDSVVYGRYMTNNVFVSYNTSGTINTYASFNGPQQPGTYAASYFLVYTNGKYFVPVSTPIQITVTDFGPVGQPIAGSYSGMVRDSANSNQTFTVNGNFRVRNQ